MDQAIEPSWIYRAVKRASEPSGPSWPCFHRLQMCSSLSYPRLHGATVGTTITDLIIRPTKRSQGDALHQRMHRKSLFQTCNWQCAGRRCEYPVSCSVSIIMHSSTVPVTFCSKRSSQTRHGSI